MKFDTEFERGLFERAYNVNLKRVGFRDGKHYVALNEQKKVDATYAAEVNMRWIAWRLSVNAPRWIKVEDGLPEKFSFEECFGEMTVYGAEVLVRLKSGKVCIAVYELMKYADSHHYLHNTFRFTGGFERIEGGECLCHVLDDVVCWKAVA